IILGLLVGNTRIPTVEDSKEVVYEKVDENGDVVYTITKQELYEEMKRNNGINQLLTLVDQELLSSYLDDITQEEINEKIQMLKFQTNDQEIIDEYDQETIDDLEENYLRSMILSGYHDGQEDEYAKLLIAKEKFVVDQIKENDDITQNEVGQYYLNSYFEDINAIKIRFLSVEDAYNVLHKYNLGEVSNELALYLGYTYDDETLEDDNEDIAEAFITVDSYYFDEDDDIRNVKEELIYELDNDIYTDQDDDTYTLDPAGNLLNDDEDIVLDNAIIFDSLTEAKAYKDANTTYYKVVKNDPFDEDETVKVYDYSDNLVYIVDDGKIFTPALVEVTDSVDLVLNKNFTPIDEVEDFTTNNTEELLEQEILEYYIKMYNYVYQEYRDILPEGSDVDDLLAIDNQYLHYNFEEVKENSATLATYMFHDISQLNDKTYSAEPKLIENYAYLVYKLTEAQKVDLKTLVMDTIKEAIIIPNIATSDIELITEGPYNSTITWKSSKPEVISNEGVVTIPEENELVSLSYTINVLGVEGSGFKTVRVYTEGESSDIDEFDEDFDDIKTLIGDNQLYNEIEDIIIDEKVYGQNARTRITNYLVDLRKEANFDIYDYYLSLDYNKDFDSEFDYDGKGNKTVLASFVDTLDGENKIEITAEDFYQNGMNRNPSLIILYAAQYKEAIHSEYFNALFGNQTNLDRNDSEQMGYLRNYIGSIKSEYNQLLGNPTYMDLYEQYYGYNFESFQTYIYTRFKTENETILLENLVLSELRMNFVNKANIDNDAINLIYQVVEDNYENFFSLNAKQVLIYFDFDEDGKLDDFNEYYDGLNAAEQTEFDALVNGLENSIKESDESFDKIVSTYRNAKRDDETWGELKQKGFILKYELLNKQEEGKNISLTYGGENGVKNKYIEEFTNALIDLYNEYQLPVNSDLDELLSSLIVTDFGIHIVKAEKGNDFDGISLKILEDDYSTISDELLNTNDKPSREQIETYYLYKLLDQYNDIENVSMSQKHGISLPKIPGDVLGSLDFYAAETFEILFSNEVVNYEFLRRINEGQVKSDLTQTEFNNNVNLLIDIYYDLTFNSLSGDDE
ncbi:MAG: hypothetical protein K9L64_06515, partial [Candidatus Izimaplasma sp.]|nr:hypothetical protein [Candidatus Izimaplasma bacterium]